MKKKIKSKIPTWKREKVGLSGISYYLHTEYLDFYIFRDSPENYKPYIELSSWLNGGSDDPLVLKEIELTPENLKDFARDLETYKRMIIRETKVKLQLISEELSKILVES